MFPGSCDCNEQIAAFFFELDRCRAGLQALPGLEGRYLVIGFSAGEIPKIPLNLVLLKTCQIVGVFWGAFTERNPEENFRNLDEMADLVRKGVLKPHISATYPLEQAAQALNDMKARKVTGKVVLVTGRD